MYFRVWQCDDKRRHVIRKIGGKSGVDPHTEPNCPSQPSSAVPAASSTKMQLSDILFWSENYNFSRFGTPGYMLELIEHEFLKKVAIFNELFHLPIGVYNFIHPPLCPSSPRSVSLYSPPPIVLLLKLHKKCPLISSFHNCVLTIPFLHC